MTRTFRRIAVGLTLVALSVIACAKAPAEGKVEPPASSEPSGCILYSDPCPLDHPTPWVAEAPVTTAGAVPPTPEPPSPPAATEGDRVDAPAVVPQAEPTPPSDDCWIELARQVGWPEAELAKLEVVIRRESGCDPTAFADRPSTLDLSRGLLQINAYGTLAGGIRQTCGIEPETLFDPAVNLACGLVYWQRMGWRPWRM